MGRRSNGEGSIRKLPSGSWNGQIMDGSRLDGKRNIISFTAPTRGEVQRKIRDYFLAKEAGEIIVRNKGQTFEFWADLWYKDHQSQVQPSTYSGYKYTLKLLKEAIAEQTVDDIKAFHLNQFYTEMAQDGWSLSKITKCRAMLIQIFDFAESNDAVRRNCARLSKVVRSTEDTGRHKDAFREDEVERLFRELPKDKLGHSIRLLLCSGIRVQELLALRKDDISEDGSLLTIKRAVKIVDGRAELGPTKSKASMRTIPLPACGRESALYLRSHSGAALVWCSTNKNLVYGIGTFRNWYYQALREVGDVRLLSPHCCRHTYVSRLEARGVPMEQIARLVGHSRVTTTDGYLHVPVQTLQAAVDVLNH